MVCLLCDFKILLTVFNQSYNCQTSHYLGRNWLPKPFLILPSLFITMLCESDFGQTFSKLGPTLEKLWSYCVLLALLACARSNLHLWLWISELKIFWGFSNILAITCQVLGGTRPTQSDFLSDFLIIKTVYQLGSNKCMIWTLQYTNYIDNQS